MASVGARAVFWTAAAVVVASIALIISAFQAWLSWSGRNDLVRSQLAAGRFQLCQSILDAGAKQWSDYYDWNVEAAGILEEIQKGTDSRERAQRAAKQVSGANTRFALRMIGYGSLFSNDVNQNLRKAHRAFSELSDEQAKLLEFLSETTPQGFDASALEERYEKIERLHDSAQKAYIDFATACFSMVRSYEAT